MTLAVPSLSPWILDRHSVAARRESHICAYEANNPGIVRFEAIPGKSVRARQVALRAIQ